jgi:hypothetical protein
MPSAMATNLSLVHQVVFWWCRKDRLKSRVKSIYRCEPRLIALGDLVSKGPTFIQNTLTKQVGKSELDAIIESVSKYSRK